MDYLNSNITVRIKPVKILRHMFTTDAATGMICMITVILSICSTVQFIRYLFDNTLFTDSEAWSYFLTTALMCGIFATIYFLEKCKLEETAEMRLKEKMQQQKQREIVKKQQQRKNNTQVKKKQVSAETQKSYMEGHKPKQKIS